MDSDHHNDATVNQNYDESDLNAWFLVSGDMDDFIFYDEPDRRASEK